MTTPLTFSMRSQRGAGQRSRQLGLTLVELMVAMTLALAIVAAVGYVYMQGKQGFTVQDGRSRLQESARLAYSIMSRDIVAGGYFGCVKPIVDTSSTIAISTLRIDAAQPLMTSNISWLELDGDETGGTRFLNPAFVIRGFDNGANWPVTTAVSSKRLAGTDTLLILKGGDDARHLTGAIDAANAEFKIASALTGVTTNGRVRPMVISNCTKGEIIKPTIESAGLQFDVANTLNQNANGGDSGSNTLRYGPLYGESSMVTTFDPVTYYIAPAKGKNGVMVPSLHRMVTTWDTDVSANIGLWDTSGGDVVIEGVEQMRVRFYVEGATEGTSDGPFTAAEVTAANKWLALLAVQIDLTLVGDDNNLRTTTTTQTVGGSSVTDSKLRQTTSFTVNIRVPKA